MDTHESLTDNDKRGIELLLAGAEISGDADMRSIEFLYGEAGITYAKEFLDAPEM
jgi:hypothetical protein